jgi:thiol-disulfide isomerase/thioredoxin
VLLNFWATWCFFCVGEMPAMQRLADRHGDRVAVVGVNVGESAADARVFAENWSIRYPLLLDAVRSVAIAYGVRNMPTSLVVDPAGVVRSVDYRVLTPPEMEARLAPYLDPGPPGTAAGRTPDLTAALGSVAGVGVGPARPAAHCLAA